MGARLTGLDPHQGAGMHLSAIIPTLGALIFVVGALAWVLRR
ncbi:hypothetical protein [Ottowia sp.]|nr:hypothetical protein [Ottowia sp.]